MKQGAPEMLSGKWRSVRLGDVCREDRCIVEARSERARQLRYLSLEHIESGTGRILREPGDAISDEGNSTTFAFDERHVLYGKLRPYLNKVALPDFSGRCTTELIPLLPTNELARDYLAFVLRRNETVAITMRGKTGSRMPRADMDTLRDMEIPLPPLDEQLRIAARLREELSGVAQARAALEAQLAAAEALPAAHLRAVFQSTEAQHWPQRRLGDFGEIVGGIQKQPDRAPVKFHKAFLTVRNVQHGALDLSRVERFEVTPAEFARCRLQRGDLLIVEGNGSLDHIGRNALFNEDGEWIHQNHIIRVRLASVPLSPKFVSHYLNSETGRAQLIEKARTTTGLYTLSAGKIASLEIPAPAPRQQAEIVTRLNAEYAATHTLRTALAAKLAEVEKLPAAILRAAFAIDAPESM